MRNDFYSLLMERESLENSNWTTSYTVCIVREQQHTTVASRLVQLCLWGAVRDDN